MDIVTPESLSNLGVGVASILAIAYIVNTYCKERDKERVSRETQNKIFIEFVNENNHKVTNLVKESTSTIVSASRNIEESTRIIKRVCDLLDRKINGN